MKAPNRSSMSRRNFLAVSGATGLTILIGCGGDNGGGGAASTGAENVPQDLSIKGTGELNVYTAGGTFEDVWTKTVHEPFEKETGIKVNRVPGEGPADYKASIVSGSGKFDLQELSPSDAQPFIDEGLLAEIDYRYWNKEDYDSFAPIKPEKFLVPWGHSPLVFFWNKERFPQGLKTWADFWDTDRFPGKRSLYPGTFGPYGPLPEAAVMADGVPKDSVYPVDLDQTFESLDRLRPAILKFAESGQEPIQLLIDGAITVGSGYNTRVQNAVDDGAPIAYTFDYAVELYDCQTVPHNAKNKENAMKFIAYGQRAEVAARLSAGIPNSTFNQRAIALVPEDRRRLLGTTEENRERILAKNYDWWTDNGPEFLERWEEWAAG